MTFLVQAKKPQLWSFVKISCSAIIEFSVNVGFYQP